MCLVLNRFVIPCIHRVDQMVWTNCHRHPGSFWWRFKIKIENVEDQNSNADMSESLRSQKMVTLRLKNRSIKIQAPAGYSLTFDRNSAFEKAWWHSEMSRFSKNDLLSWIWSFEFWSHNDQSREAIRKMGKISEILLNSLFIGSAYANNFEVLSCNNDAPVSLTKRFR